MTDRQAIAEGARRKPHRRAGLPVIATVVIIVAVGALVGWTTAKYFTGRIAETAAVQIKLPASESSAPVSLLAVAAKREVDAGTTTEPVRAPLRIDVDSYPLSVGYALAEWSAGAGNSGHLDGASVNGKSLVGNDAAKRAAPLGNGDVIELTGWAGDAVLGVRYPFVLISACGKVVAHVAVTLPRSDVAAAVHPNLGRSGWRARVAARHLPSCEDTALRAWGVAPGDRKLILPLTGRAPVSAAPSKDGQAVWFETSAPPVRPSDMKPLAPIQLAIYSATLNMRRCASVDCKVVGRLKKGELTAVTLDDAGDWLLIAMPERAGWVAKRYVGVTRGRDQGLR